MKFLILLALVNIFDSKTTNALSRTTMDLLKHKEPPVPVAKSTKSATEGWITQKLDHFDTSSTKTFQMRYYANDEFYQSGGPFFIYVGGEWEINEGSILGGHYFDMAREMKGYLFYTEHRYYGKTRPTEDLTPANLQYLHIDQALEDLAHFIRYKKASVEGAFNSGVIMVGGSYAATMVSWFRQRYPDLVNGVWSSSAPLLAKLDYPEYKEVVGKAITAVAGSPCYNRIQRAFAQIGTAIDTLNFELLDKTFNTCTQLSSASQLDIWNFFDSVSHMMSGLVQYHSGTQIRDACNIIMNPEIVDDLVAFEAFAKSQMGARCLNYSYQSTIDYIGETTWESGSAQSNWRQWQWQTCFEYGWFQTMNSTNHPFGERDYAEMFTTLCNDAYPSTFLGQSVVENIQRTNLWNYALNPTFTNVYSTHGELDPWSAMGLAAAPNVDSPVVIIPWASHCADFGSISPSDSTEMRAAKEQVQALVIKWLA